MWSFPGKPGSSRVTRASLCSYANRGSGTEQASSDVADRVGFACIFRREAGTSHLTLNRAKNNSIRQMCALAHAHAPGGFAYTFDSHH